MFWCGSARRDFCESNFIFVHPCIWQAASKTSRGNCSHSKFKVELLQLGKEIIFVVLCSIASRWEEAGGPLQAAGLGCAQHSTLVSTKTQPGKAQYSYQVLWEHVRMHVLFLSLVKPVSSSVFPFVLHGYFCRWIERWYRLVEYNFLNEKNYLLSPEGVRLCVLSMVKSFQKSRGCDSILSGCQPDPLRQIAWC